MSGGSGGQVVRDPRSSCRALDDAFTVFLKVALQQHPAEVEIRRPVQRI